MDQPEFSVVVPVFDEEDSLPELFAQLDKLMSRLDGSAEVILVDDGSRDGSHALMVAMNDRDPRFKVVRLSRNFGHQIAITAGLDAASGSAVVVMDADLQDPPEVVLEMVAKWRQGYEVVYAVRDEREGDSAMKRMTASAFYRVLRKLSDVDVPVDVGDFRLIDRKALEAFKKMRESNRYVRGMFGWIGFNQTGIHYKRAPRHRGATKYPFRKMLKFAVDGVLSFSTLPLRIALVLGLWLAALSFLAGVVAVILKIAGAYTVPGWASLVVGMLFLGGVQLTILGAIGEYVARIFDEVKDRPLYLVQEVRGLDEEPESLVIEVEAPGASRAPMGRG